jgi:hypothetical protein
VLNRYIAGLAVDPSDSAHVCLAVNGFSWQRTEGPGAGSGHVFESHDDGATWQDISANLPEVPANALPARPDGGIVLATDTGVVQCCGRKSSPVPDARHGTSPRCRSRPSTPGTRTTLRRAMHRTGRREPGRPFRPRHYLAPHHTGRQRVGRIPSVAVLQLKPGPDSRIYPATHGRGLYAINADSGAWACCGRYNHR